MPLRHILDFSLCKYLDRINGMTPLRKQSPGQHRGPCANIFPEQAISGLIVSLSERKIHDGDPGLHVTIITKN
ncbi:hypothetical protein BOX30_01945 [Leptospirillum ferriphilum]|nr:hypothetical protein BOX30_01945 [Leptospirillum ferriphilum]